MVIEYEIREVYKLQSLWKWKIKHTFAWTYCDTKGKAIEEVKAHAKLSGSKPMVTFTNLFGDQIIEELEIV